MLPAGDPLGLVHRLVGQLPGPIGVAVLPAAGVPDADAGPDTLRVDARHGLLDPLDDPARIRIIRSRNHGHDSSPPVRGEQVAPRRTPDTARATPTRILSPTSCPWASLMALRLSMSITRMPIASGRRSPSRQRARPRRFAIPVKGSELASARGGRVPQGALGPSTSLQYVGATHPFCRAESTNWGNGR
jgi:hypothetical protein